MVRVPEVLAGSQMRIVIDLAVVLDRGARDPGALEHPEPLARGPGPRDRFDDRDERGAIADARALVDKSRVVDEHREAESLAQSDPVPPRDRADREAAVRAADGLIGRRILVRRAQRARDLAGGEEESCFPDGERHGALEERDVDELTAPGVVARSQRGE